MKQESTLLMRKYYMKLFFGGKGPKEIAKVFRLSVTTVYHELDAIAKEYTRTTGIPCCREDLLESPNHSGERLSFKGRLSSSINLTTNEEEIEAAAEEVKRLIGETADSLAEKRKLISTMLVEEGGIR